MSGRGKFGMKEISAGGVVYRRVDGRVEIQLIRDRFGKITLPKGKMEQGETAWQTALREIEEETGIRGRIEAKVDRVFYTYTGQDNETVDKEVHYFLVEAVSGSLKAQEEEIGGVSWHSPEEAWRLQRDMGYGNNDRVLAGAFRLLGIGVDGVG
jgi:NTP pyrophosphohydrolases including oxidative damage repair enzymes